MTDQTFSDRTRDAYERYARELRHFVLRRTQSPPEADEIVQETFLRYHAIAGEGTVEQPRGLLYRIATNLSADYHRRNARQGVTQVPAPNAGEGTEIPGLEIPAALLPDRLEQREDLDAVLEAIERLPRRARQVFLLRRIDGLSYRQISARIGISEKTVGKHLAKAVDRVAAAYAKHRANGQGDAS